jgi:hypothetical protein
MESMKIDRLAGWLTALGQYVEIIVMPRRGWPEAPLVFRSPE